ncbi:MAG: hypothetical protein LBO67_06245 [Spirochaetaceae bacterium]|nr:hypothetical protein [Spirochaetaceae bacterium]
MSHVVSTSSTSAAAILYTIIPPAAKSSMGVFFQSPYSGGKSLQGTPVLIIYNTALINRLKTRPKMG